MLFAVLAACGGINNLTLTLPLPGEPYGMALTADGQLAITHRDETGLKRLSVYNRNTSARQFGHPAGPGVPVVGDGRLYVLQDDGVVAFRGLAVDWQHTVTGQLPNDAAIGLTQAGVVVFGTQGNGAGVVHAVTHLGFPLWTTPLLDIPRGAPVTDGLDTVYVAAGDEVPEVLYALDGTDGTVLWSVASTGRPLLALPDGVIVAQTDGLTRYDHEGTVIWSTPVVVTSLTTADSNSLWAVGTGVQRLSLDSGTVIDSYGAICGPVAADVVGAAWSLCTLPGVAAPELTTIEFLPTAQSAPIGVDSLPVDAPIHDSGTTYTLVGGPNPRLLGFATGTRSSDSSWARGSGGATNDWRVTP